MIDNFPLFNSLFNLSKEDIFSYIFLFPKHDILFTENPDFLYTYHRFKDGLLLKFSWKFEKEISIPSARKTTHVHSLKELVDSNDIQLNEARILFYSDINNNSSSFAFETFYQIIKDKNRLLTQEEYDSLEYEIKSQSEIPDSFFREIICWNQNYINFKRFLKDIKKVDVQDE